MSTTTEPMTWRERAACKERPDLFTALALDYDPADDEFADLTPAEHAAHAAAKTAAEAAAVDFCFGCPVMQDCEKWALDTGASTGVLGGLTEAERTNILASRGITVTAEDTSLTATVRDRGPRLQVDDDAVARLTAAGRDAAYIAREMGCSERTVVRSRARRAARVAAEQTARQEQAVVEVTAPQIDAASVAVIAEIDAQIAALQTAARPARRADNGSREVSPAMAAIYALLADGQWHTREALVAAGMAQIGDADALEWWTRTNSIAGIDGSKVLNPAKAATPVADRIALGARDKVSNMLSASARTQKNTERGGPTGTDRDLYRITAKGRSNALSPLTRQPIAA